jgi:hypothetical protein
MDAQTSKHTKNPLFLHDRCFQPVLIESIVRDDKSHVVGTVAHRITSPRLGWGEQRVVLLEMEGQTFER